MKTTVFPVGFNGSWLRIALSIIALATLAHVVYAGNRPFAGSALAVPQGIHSALPDGITLAGQTSKQDIAYLQEGLRLLHDHLPQWYTYLAEAKPLVLEVDLEIGRRGVAAKAKCCDVEGVGTITFGDHFGDWGISDEPDDQTFQARQITFLSTLVHEVTHLRDQRAGRLSTLQSVACVEGEKSAMTQEVEFMRALTAVKLGNDLDSSMPYQRAIERQSSIVAGDVNRAAWYFYCSLQHQNEE